MSDLLGSKHGDYYKLFMSPVALQITEIKPLDLRLKFGTGLHGWVHITEVRL